MMELDRVVMYSGRRALISALTTARAVWRVKCSVVMNCMIGCRAAPAGGPSPVSKGPEQGRGPEEGARGGQGTGGGGRRRGAGGEGGRGSYSVAGRGVALDHPGAGGD